MAERYPTVEVRVADVCTEIEDAALVALLARALVDRVLEATGDLEAVVDDRARRTRGSWAD